MSIGLELFPSRTAPHEHCRRNWLCCRASGLAHAELAKTGEFRYGRLGCEPVLYRVQSADRERRRFNHPLTVSAPGRPFLRVDRRHVVRCVEPLRARISTCALGTRTFAATALMAGPTLALRYEGSSVAPSVSGSNCLGAERDHQEATRQYPDAARPVLFQYHIWKRIRSHAWSLPRSDGGGRDRAYGFSPRSRRFSMARSYLGLMDSALR